MTSFMEFMKCVITENSVPNCGPFWTIVDHFGQFGTMEGAVAPLAPYVYGPDFTCLNIKSRTSDD